MNCKIYILLIASSLVSVSCKSDTKPEAKTKIIESQPITKKEDSVIAVVAKSNATVSVTETKIVDISSIEEIVSKADHNTTLRLKKGKYELPDNLVYFVTADKKEIINKNVTETRSVGGQVFISGMTNFSIIGNDSEIFSNNPQAVPLFILSANHGEFTNLTLGHKASGEIQSPVPSLYISNSNNVKFSHCKLGNHSKAGIKINNSKLLTFTNCNISKAHSQIMEIYQGQSIQFINSTYKNNECTFGCFNFLGTDNSLDFKNVNVINNRSIGKKSNNYRQLVTGPANNIEFKNSKFNGNQNFDHVGIDEANLIDCEVQNFKK
ncbi:MAG: hypothetical protein ACJA1A_001608 [Saprospiraceae bacterium]|jgi:hypothetical protein|tara:strand:- start:2176 stop:3141 length:966 start_codon:yes stop_codon:yes gene_type:complete